MMSAHGVNIGHGFVKYTWIDGEGQPQPMVTFPALVAASGGKVSGALGEIATVPLNGRQWLVGEDALHAASPLTILSRERLSDPVFIPALVRGALLRLGLWGAMPPAMCVTGLPATWAQDVTLARDLGARLRDATDGYQSIRVIPEPLGLVYAALLDDDGQIAGEAALRDGVVGVVDIGHHTVDLAVIRGLVPNAGSLTTFQLGTARPLQAIRSRLSATFERELTLFETDEALRAGVLRVAGAQRALPPGCDLVLREHAAALAARLVESWGSGAQLDAIVLGGGGAALDPLVQAVQARFPQAQVIDAPQGAVARGYARLARRLAREGR